MSNATTMCFVCTGQWGCWRCGEFIETILCSQSLLGCSICPNYGIKCPDYFIDYIIYKKMACVDFKHDLELAVAEDEKMVGNGENSKEQGSS